MRASVLVVLGGLLWSCACRVPATQDARVELAEDSFRDVLSTSAGVWRVCSTADGVQFFFADRHDAGITITTRAFADSYVADSRLLMSIAAAPTMPVLHSVCSVKHQDFGLLVDSSNSTGTSSESTYTSNDQTERLFACAQPVGVALTQRSPSGFNILLPKSRVCGFCSSNDVAVLHFDGRVIDLIDCVPAQSSASSFALVSPFRDAFAFMDLGVARVFEILDAGAIERARVPLPAGAAPFAFYPDVRETRILLVTGSTPSADIVVDEDGGHIVPPLLPSWPYFQGMASVDGLTIDAVFSRESSRLGFVSVTGDGGFRQREVADDPNRAGPLQFASYQGRTVAFIRSSGVDGGGSVRAIVIR